MVAPIIKMPNTEKHSGVSGIPTQLLVLHSGECPLRGGYAQSLTSWANVPLSQGGPEASWHWFVDPIAIVSQVDPNCAAWHASEANPMSEGFEQSGYARYTRAEWLTPEGLKQIDNLAWIMALRAKANGIPPVWLTTAQVNAITSGRDRTTKGLCIHRQIDPETRTDPGDGYPFDVLTAKIKAHMGGAAIGPAGNTTKEDTLSAADADRIIDHINALFYGGATWKGEKRYPLYDLEAETQKRVGQVPARVAAFPVKRGGKTVAWVQETADTKTKVLGLEPAIARIEDNTDPAALADLIPDALAQQVIDALAARLNGAK